LYSFPSTSQSLDGSLSSCRTNTRTSFRPGEKETAELKPATKYLGFRPRYW